MTQAHERTATLSQLVGKQIKLKLFLAEMSGRDLAIKLGVSPSWVSYRLSGKQEIGLDDLFRIAKALDVEVNELMTADIVAQAAEPKTTLWYPALTVRTPITDRPPNNRPSGRPLAGAGAGVGRTAYVSRSKRRGRDE